MRIDILGIVRSMIPILIGVLLGVAVAAAAGAAHAAPPEADGMKRDAAETYDDIKQYSFEQKEQLATWLGERMRAADREIAELETKARNAGDSAAQRWQTARAALAEKRTALAERTAALGAVSRDAWDATKRGVANAYDDLKQGFQDARKNME